MFLLILAFFFQTLSSDSIEIGWKSIKPLKTGKTTAEKILGKPEIYGSGIHTYETEEAKVQINYSTDPCTKSEMTRGDFVVPKDTVLEYYVFPKTQIKIRDFKYNREKYIKSQTLDQYTELRKEFFDFEYVNDDDGVEFATKERDGVEYIYNIVFRLRIKNINYRECTSKINFEAEKGWEGILPLKTDKAAVEKILGTPAESSDYSSEYKMEEVWIQVKYTSEPCRKTELGRGDYDVPKDTVLTYEISLNKALKLTDFKYNRDKYDLYLGGNYFKNDEDGIYFITQKRDNSQYVSSITFEPGAKDTANLKCKTMKE